MATDDRTTVGPNADRPTGGRVSRRVVAAGLAWSVPAVVVASPAPAMAASGVAPLLQLVAPCLNPTGGSSWVAAPFDVLRALTIGVDGGDVNFFGRE